LSARLEYFEASLRRKALRSIDWMLRRKQYRRCSRFCSSSSSCKNCWKL